MPISRRFFCASAGIGALSSLCGCWAGPCAPPDLPLGVTWPGTPTLGEVRTCRQETPESLHGIKVVLPPDAPSILSDYRTALDVNFAVRPFRHTGIDIAGVEGKTRVIAALNGTVDAARHYFSGGYCVILHHGVDARGHDFITGYFHLDRILVEPGAKVRRGDTLGLVGMTGTTSGSVPHLHYNVFVGRNLKDVAFWQYFQTAHVNPHLYWAAGPGKISLFDPTVEYPANAGATYPVTRI